jgi:cytochrome c oxidase assembly protein subunit 11
MTSQLAMGTSRPGTSGKRTTLLVILFLFTCSAALVSAAVPLYRLYCQATGYGGTTQTATAAPGAAAGLITVRFNADTATDLPWTFKPAQGPVTIHLGEQVTVFFEATNPTNRTITGHATFNVTPDKAGEYFAKIQCFCFTEQTLAPGETAMMPVTFFVDPEIAKDPLTDEVGTITLSYTFFESQDETNSAATTSGSAATTTN